MKEKRRTLEDMNLGHTWSLVVTYHRCFRYCYTLDRVGFVLFLILAGRIVRMMARRGWELVAGRQSIFQGPINGHVGCCFLIPVDT